MFAVILTGGKQYLVQQGDTLMVEKLPSKKGGSITFKDVLMVFDGKTHLSVGKSRVSGAHVTALVLESEVKGKKVRGIKFKPKKRYLRRLGHRQQYTKVKIEKIETK